MKTSDRGYTVFNCLFESAALYLYYTEIKILNFSEFISDFYLKLF